MGANEKPETTYHGEEYTPVAESVRERYMHDRHMTDGVAASEARAEFNRWLEAVRAEAKAEALNEAAVEIDRLDSDVEMYDENLNATQVTFWVRNRANQYKEEA